MKKRKAAILLALSLSITAVFTACGGSSQGSSAPAQPEEQTDAAEPAAEAEPAEAAEQAEAVEPAAEAEPAEAAEQTEAAEPAGAADQKQADAGQDQAADAAADQAAPAQPAEPAADKFRVELEEVGRVSGKKDYRVTYDSLVHNEGDHVTFCDFNGNPVDERPLANMEYLGWGLYSVTVQVEGEVNSTGLVSGEGDILIPFDAAIITFPSEHPKAEQPRYILVLTGTEQTTNQDEALFFVTSRQFAITANDDDIFFKGTLKVFDLKARQYVNGLEYTKGTGTDFAQVGDNILVDLGDQAVVYSPDGTAVYTEQGSLYYNYKYMTDRIGANTVIMDANGNTLYETEAVTNMVDYNSEYISRYNGGKYTVINANGQTVLGGEWNYIYGEDKNRFRVKNDGDTVYSLVAQDNSVIASGPNMFEGDPLGFVSFGENKNYTVVTPGNRVIDGIESDSDELVFTKDDETSYLVLNTGEFVPADGNDISGIGKGVIALENAEGKNAVIDAFTGQELMGFEYDEIDDVNDDYIYYEDGDDIVILKVVIVPES